MSFLQNFHHQITGPAGNSPKLVFLHGVMGFSSNWRRIAKAFENEYQVLVFDQRGHGRTTLRPPSGYAPEDYGDDLRQILDELGWEEINLVGHSMGGRTALHFGASYPQRVTRLVIEDIGPNLPENRQSTVIKIIDTVPVPFPDRQAAKTYFESTFFEQFKEVSQPKGLAAYLFANISENEQKQAVWRFSVPAIRESMAQGRMGDRWDEVRALRMPTLIVRGEHSTDLTRDVYEEVLETNPVIEGVEIADAGHWVHSDKPDEFIEALRRFLGPKGL